MDKFGSTLLHFDTVTSTNDIAREMAGRGAEEGTAVVARHQTAGRGRSGRSWASAEGEGLYLSIILRPRISVSVSSIIPLAAAVAVAETLQLDFNIRADIKWPNDVLIAGRKVCGILVESAIERDQIQHAVLGIGVNISQRNFPDEIKETATSLLIEAGLDLSPQDFLKPLLDRLDLWYRKALIKSDEVRSQWEKLSSYARGRRVRVISADEEIEGVTCGLTPTGCLVIETCGGERREITSGEISLREANRIRY